MILGGIGSLRMGDDLTRRTRWGDRATKIKGVAAPSEATFAVAERLIALLGKPAAEDSRGGCTRRVEARDCRSLATIAATANDGNDGREDILLIGTFIMWIESRARLSLNSVSKGFALPQWLATHPPGQVLVGPDESGKGDERLVADIVKRASQRQGPVDKWFRQFRIEH